MATTNDALGKKKQQQKKNVVVLSIRLFIYIWTLAEILYFFLTLMLQYAMSINSQAQFSKET